MSRQKGRAPRAPDVHSGSLGASKPPQRAPQPKPLPPEARAKPPAKALQAKANTMPPPARKQQAQQVQKPPQQKTQQQKPLIKLPQKQKSQGISR